MLERLVNYCRDTKEELSEVRDGYSYAKRLVNQVNAQSHLMLTPFENEQESESIAAGIFLLLGEYQMQLAEAQEDLQMYDTMTNHHLGMLFYTKFHPKKHKQMTEFWKHLARKYTPIDVPSSEISSEKISSVEYD